MDNICPTTGPVVQAAYQPAALTTHTGNPMIEALPPLVSDDRALDGICWKPTLQPEERALPTALRVARLLELQNLLIPLGRHVELITSLDSMLRAGYVGRHPHSPANARVAQELYEARQSGKSFRQLTRPSPVSLSAALIGLPGMGKTSLVKSWCDRLEKAIYHPKLNVYQVPALKADAPSDGSSIKGFCYSLLHELDSRIPGANYYHEFGVRGRPGSESMLQNVVRLCNTHFLGMLVIDECQNFENSQKSGQTVMTELVSAFNLLRTPLVFMGTNRAYKVFGKDFRSARRSVVVPLPHWNRLPQYAEPGADDEWLAVVKILWELQWVRSPCELDEWSLQVLYECTQGVLAILIALFVASQMRAMHNRSEKLTPQLIQEVYESELRPVHPMIKALRNNDNAALEYYQDVAPPLQQQLWAQSWAFGGSVPVANKRPSTIGDATSAGAVDGESPVNASSTTKRPVRRRSRVPTARKGGDRKLDAQEDLQTPTDLAPDDYRRASRAAKDERGTTYEELQRRGQTPTVEEILGAL